MRADRGFYRLERPIASKDSSHITELDFSPLFYPCARSSLPTGTSGWPGASNIWQRSAWFFRVRFSEYRPRKPAVDFPAGNGAKRQNKLSFGHREGPDRWVQSVSWHRRPPHFSSPIWNIVILYITTIVGTIIYHGNSRSKVGESPLWRFLSPLVTIGCHSKNVRKRLSIIINEHTFGCLVTPTLAVSFPTPPIFPKAVHRQN